MLTYGRRDVTRYEDNCFTADGAVRLPKLAGLAMGMALRSGGPLSNQPTEERARAIAAASEPIAASKGARVEVQERPSGRWVVLARALDE